MFDALHLTAVVALAAVFAVSATLKLRDKEGVASSLRELGRLPARLVPFAARGLPLVELVIAVGLCVTSGRVFTSIAVTTFILTLLFAGVVAVALTSGTRPACHCFGQLSRKPISSWTLARNVLLIVLSAFAAWARQPFDGVADVFADLPTAERVWVLTVLVGGIAVSGLTAALLTTRDARARALEALAAERARPAARVPVEIPSVAVVDRSGREVRLGELVTEKAHLVFFVSPGCQACEQLKHALPGWRRALEKELEVTVISAASWEASVAAYPEEEAHLYVDPQGAARRALRVEGTPAAVLLGLNHTVAAGPAHGAEKILELITAVIQAIGVNVMTGVAHQIQSRAPGGEDTGDAFLPSTGMALAPFSVRAEDGTVGPFVEVLEALGLGEAVPVVAWRHSCGYCAEILEFIREHSARGEVVLLTTESIELTRAQGITGPILQTVDIDATTALAVPGTPAGFPVRHGRVAEGGGVGGGSVLRMLRDRSARALASSSGHDQS